VVPAPGRGGRHRRQRQAGGHGFTARTRWWSSQADQGSSASTGGGEVAFATRIHAFDLRATSGIARSFYPTLDNAALGAPAVGLRSTLQLSRALDL